MIQYAYNRLSIWDLLQTGEGGTPSDGLYRGAPPEKFREICHLAWVCERAQ